MYRIFYKGKETQYPDYNTESDCIEALKDEGVTDEQLNDTWTSPRGVEKIITIKKVSE